VGLPVFAHAALPARKGLFTLLLSFGLQNFDPPFRCSSPCLAVILFLSSVFGQRTDAPFFLRNLSLSVSPRFLLSLFSPVATPFNEFNFFQYQARTSLPGLFLFGAVPPPSPGPVICPAGAGVALSQSPLAIPFLRPPLFLIPLTHASDVHVLEVSFPRTYHFSLNLSPYQSCGHPPGNAPVLDPFPRILKFYPLHLPSRLEWPNSTHARPPVRSVVFSLMALIPCSLHVPHFLNMTT